jgi:hypothetical protein
MTGGWQRARESITAVDLEDGETQRGEQRKELRLEHDNLNTQGMGNKRLTKSMVFKSDPRKKASLR